MKTDQTVTTTTTATEDRVETDKESKRATVMHTHTNTHASASSKWHSRRSEKRRDRIERQTKKRNGTHERNLVVEQ